MPNPPITYGSYPAFPPVPPNVFKIVLHGKLLISMVKNQSYNKTVTYFEGIVALLAYTK